jgi:hypothetical protein
MQLTHEELAKVLKITYLNKTPIDIKGPPGIGKSELVREFANVTSNDEKRIFCAWNEISNAEKIEFVTDPEKIKKYLIFVDTRLTQMDPTDLKGFPDKTSNYIKWVPNLVYYVLSDPNAKAIVFFDEANLAPPSVQAACYQIFNDHCIGETPIAKGVFVISAGNRVADNQEVFPEAPPLRNRKFNYELLPPSVKDWSRWAYDNGVDSRVIAFVSWKEEYLFKYDEESKSDSFPTPRSWTKLGRILTTDMDMRTIEILAGGAVSKGIAQEFVAFTKLADSLISVQQLIKTPSAIKKFCVAGKEDQIYSILSNLVHYYKNNLESLDSMLQIMLQIEKPEFAVFFLRTLKSADKSFTDVVTKTSSWKAASRMISEYLL